jgi:hypothetical protein
MTFNGKSTEEDIPILALALELICEKQRVKHKTSDHRTAHKNCLILVLTQNSPFG